MADVVEVMLLILAESPEVIGEGVGLVQGHVQHGFGFFDVAVGRNVVFVEFVEPAIGPEGNLHFHFRPARGDGNLIAPFLQFPEHVADAVNSPQWFFPRQKARFPRCIRLFPIRLFIEFVTEIPVLEGLEFQLPQGRIEGRPLLGARSQGRLDGIGQIGKDFVLAGPFGDDIAQAAIDVVGRRYGIAPQERAQVLDIVDFLQAPFQTAVVGDILFQHEPQGDDDVGVNHVPVAVDAVFLEPQ